MQNDLPIVTVVTPTFNLIKNNRRNVFIDCVNSVREQSYGNIEHIFIDNASDDGTIELLKEQGVTFFSEPDAGIFNAFNKGVQRANGKYVIFLGTDDYYHSKFGIEMSVRALENEEADFSFAESLFTMDNITTQVFEVNLFNTFKTIPYSHQTVMCKRDVLLEMPFDESYKISGDVHWHIRMMIQGYKMVNVGFNFAYNRFTGTCVSNYEKGSTETDRMNKELFYDIYHFSDKEAEEMSFYRIFPKELDEYFSKYFDSPKEYMEHCENYNQEQEVLKTHKFLKDLIQRSKELNGNIVAELEKQFNIPEINDILYTKLDDESKKKFLDFFLKKYGNLNTGEETKSEEKYLDELFNKAKALKISKNALKLLLK